MRNSRLFRSDSLIILGAIIVIAGLAAVGLNAYINRDNRWTPIVAPEGERAVEILAVTRLLQPYIRTESGAFYRCSGGTWRDTCERVDAANVPTARLPARWLTCQPKFPVLPPLPAPIISTLDAGQCQEARTYARLVILEDGTLWRWQRTFSWVNGFAFASGLLVSILLGGGVGLAIVRVRHYLRTPAPPPPRKPTASDLPPIRPPDKHRIM